MGIASGVFAPPSATRQGDPVVRPTKLSTGLCAIDCGNDVPLPVGLTAAALVVAALAIAARRWRQTRPPRSR